MRSIVLLFLLAALGAAAYWWLDQEIPSPVAKLSSLVDEHVDELLGPLPPISAIPSSATSPTHDLRSLREDILDQQKQAPPGQRQKFQIATELCGLLIAAAESRDQHIARLADTRAKNTVSPLSENPGPHAAERLRFFQNGITRSWLEASTKLRSAIDRKYTQLRLLERQ